MANNRYDVNSLDPFFKQIMGDSYYRLLHELSMLHDSLCLEKPQAKASRKASIDRALLGTKSIVFAIFDAHDGTLDFRDNFSYCIEFQFLFDEYLEAFDEDEDVADDKEELKKRQKARRLAQKHVKATHCLMCGENKGRNLHRHHYDYDKPIDVFVLCLKHHFRLHKAMRSIGRMFTKEETTDYILGCINLAKLNTESNKAQTLKR